MPTELTPEEIRRRFGAAATPAPAAEPATAPAAEPPPGSPATTTELRMVFVGDVIPTPDNPRKRSYAKDPAFEELVKSVAGVGILQPLVARPHPDLPGKLDLRAGHRRLAAAQAAGLAEVPVMVREMTDRTAMEVTVLENLQRVDLTPLEEARGVALLRESGHDLEEIAGHMGKSRAWIVRRSHLLNLTKGWQDWAEEHGASAAHLELIARYDEWTQVRLRTELTEEYGGEELWHGPGSLALLKKALAESMRDLLLAPWSLDDATLHPAAGACAQCPKRSGCQPDLFDAEETSGGDRCLDDVCWRAKMDAHKARKEAALRAEHPGLIKVAGERGSNYDSQGRPMRDVLPEWQYEKTTATAKGAVPALVVSGEGEGKLVFVKPRQGAMGGDAGKRKIQTAAAKQAAASQDPKACEALLAEKREELQLRRLLWVNGYLRKELEESPMPGRDELRTADGLCLLLEQFGGQKVYGGRSNLQWEAIRTRAALTAATMETRQRVWEDVCVPRLKELLVVARPADIGEWWQHNAQGIAWLLGWDWQALLDKAEAEIPEPKSWDGLKKLIEAPAPKKKPAKKAAKKAAKKGGS